MQHVTIVGIPKVLGTSITIPMEMLNAASLIMKINSKNHRNLTLEIASTDGKNLNLTAGLELVCKRKLTDINNTDLIIIPALWGNPTSVVKHSHELLAWLNQQYKKEVKICAVGTGSFFLAEAGLLENKVATTHWYYFDQFEKLYPHLHLQRDRFITKAGNIYCAGSVNSVRDVMLHFIEESYNADTANQVSQHFTHEVKRSYTSVYLKNAPQNIHDDELIINIQEWMHSRYALPITLESIALNFDLSIRTLNRRFRQATGKSPIQYLQQLRMDNAKSLLKTSNLSIAEIAYSVGYTDNSYFSVMFKKMISMSPRKYRTLVRKKLFQVDT